MAKKTGIVTGAGQGIGFQICRQFAREGLAVVLNDLDADLAEKAAATIRKEGGSCVAFGSNVSDAPAGRQLVEKAVSTFGNLDVAVANAGITVFGSFLDFREEDFRKVLNVNLVGSYFFAQAAANQMVKQGGGGAILFTSSVTGHQAHKNLTAYGMTKAALEMLCKNLVVELSQYKIRVNAVAPGATLTERTGQNPDYSKAWSGVTPMGRPATPDDIAHAVAFLASDNARQITGQTLVVDGGWTATSPVPKNAS